MSVRRKVSAEMERDDPELAAEREYAQDHGETVVEAVRPELKKSSSFDERVRSTSINGVVNVPRSEKNLRRSRSGKGRGLPKKGGGGGKGVWGKPGAVMDDDCAALDSHDPNYDSESDDEVSYEPPAAMSMEKAVREVTTIIQDFFESPNVQDAVEAVSDLKLTRRQRQQVIRILVGQAVEHKPSLREQSSELIAELTSSHVLSSGDVYRGFQTLLKDDLSDLAIDYPSAPEVVGNFMARAVADVSLSPSILQNVSPRSGVLAEAFKRAEVMLKQKHRLDNIWGVGGGTKPVRFLVGKIDQLLAEYLDSADKDEAGRCMVELEVPHFNHELVFQAGVKAIEGMHERTIRLLSQLLSHLYATGVVSADAMQIGFKRLYTYLPELALDVPPAHALMEKWLGASVDLGYVTSDLARQMPQRGGGRKRFVSEGDGGKLLCMDFQHPLI